MYLLTILLCYIWCIYSELILNHDTTWIDDFAYDSFGETGWNIRQISGYSISNTNPTILISNEPKYHGPFPSSYAIERHISCNTTHNSRLFVSFLTSYCNTDKKGDEISLSIIDPSNTFTMPTLPKYKLYNQQQQLFNRNDLSFIQNSTAYYYTNHSSSSSIIPQCSTNISEWYTSNTHRSYQLSIKGNYKYKIIIQILLSNTDKYVIISNIALLCVETPAFNPPFLAEKYTTSEPTNLNISTSVNVYKNEINKWNENESYILTSSIMNDANISNGFRYINISKEILTGDNFELKDILFYGIEIFLIVSFCCICACIAACTSVYISNKLNALKIAKKLQNDKKGHSGLVDIIKLIPQLQMVATASCTCQVEDHNNNNLSQSDSESINKINISIKKKQKKNCSDAASIDVNVNNNNLMNDYNEIIEGDPEDVNNESFRIENKIINCNNYNEKEENDLFKIINEENNCKYNDNACSELEDYELSSYFYNDEGNELNDNAASGDEQEDPVLNATSPR